MSNPAFPNLVKIGKSKKDPTTDRVNELNQTGVPEPFKVEYYAFVEDEDYLERVIHQKFASQRPNKNREFFSVDCVEAIDAIRQLSKQKIGTVFGNKGSNIKYEEVLYVSPEELARFRKQEDKKDKQRQKEEEQYAREREKQKLEEQKERVRKEREYIRSERLSKWGKFGFYSFAIFFALIAYVDGDNGVTAATEDLLMKVYFGGLCIYALITWWAD